MKNQYEARSRTQMCGGQKSASEAKSHFAERQRLRAGCPEAVSIKEAGGRDV